MEGIKKKAIEKLRKQKEDDYHRGYTKAFEMAAEGHLDLKEVEELATSDEPWLDVFEGQSEAFVEGFTDACSEMLRETKKD